ncbi:MAG: VWA domain-containing protein, partial [Chromatiales bacterium]
MIPHDFHLLRPLWLLALLPLLLLLWRLLRSEAGGDVWRGLVDAHLLPQLLSDDGGRVRRLPLVLLGLGWLLGVLALAGPTWERLPQPVYQAQQYRVLALDLSPTMNATDMPPSRLAHARFELQDLLRKAREGQTALLAYGTEPYVVAPLTSDTATIAAQVPSLRTDLLPIQGPRRTDLALAKAGELLSQAGAPDGEVILITDGLDHPAAADEAARKLRNRGYRVSVLGVGTAKGAPVPGAAGGFLKDADGAILLPKLKQELLRELASVGAGLYVKAGLDDRDIEALIPSGPSRFDRQVERQQTRSDQWREAGPWLLLILLPLAAFAFRRGWLTPLVLVLLVMPPPPAQAYAWQDLWLWPDQQAAQDFAAGRQSEAAQRFERQDWRAAAAYASGDYDQALQSLEGLKDSRSAYNKGNTLARLGRLEDAIAAYDQALAVNPDDEDALHNKTLVQQLLEQQRQQQQDQQQSGQQGEQGQQDPSAQQAQQGKQNQSDEQGQQQSGQQGQDQQSGEQGQQKQTGAQAQQQQPGEQDQAEQNQQAEGQGQQAQQESKQQAGERDQQSKQEGSEQNPQAQQAQAGEEKSNEEQA